ncbi:MAG: SprB repeat-containing protein, partial [Cyclobacteriaceae bacterium]
MADGSIDLTVSGVTGAHTIAWSNGLEGEHIQALAPGQYTMTVTDDKNCSASATFSIGTVSKIDITAAQVRPDCNGSNGSIDITASGGTGPYSFSWSNGATTEDLQNMKAGLYTVTVSDNAGCTAQGTYFLRDIVTLTLKGESIATSCVDDASGAIDLTVAGGAAPYSYSWSNGATTEDLSGLTSGTYTVTVTDSKNCSVTATFPVTKTTFQVPRIVVQPSCHGGADGSITLQAPIGGTGPFTYLWSNEQTGTALTGLDAGTYSVTVMDATGCSRTLTSMITDPTEIFADATVSNVQCNADGFFSVDLTISGGTTPYGYEWSNGSNTQNIDGLQSGTYTVVITDARGCSISKEVIVEGLGTPWSCVINELTSMPLCGSANNTLSTSVTVADSYSWSVESTDGNWSIASSASSSIAFTAGGEYSSATFSLTIVKEGCTETCTYTVSACSAQNNGGGSDPGSEDPGEDPGNGEGGDQTCEECFNTIVKVIDEAGTCRTYEMEVNTNGLCRHDLSHWTLAIPCGTVSNYSNSRGWKMEFGKDPTTGLYGLKVDDINGFGKEGESFTVRFTVCKANDCELSGWDPTVAYKAGLCVGVQMPDTE